MIFQLAVFAVATLLAMSPQAAIYSWSAESGVFPNQIDSRMELRLAGTAESPVLTGSVLTLATSPNREKMMFYEQTSVVIPSTLQIEARVRFVSGSTAMPGPFLPRSHLAIRFITSDNIGNRLAIAQDKLYLLSAPDVLGPEVTVDTDDAFHTYRIVVSGVDAGSAIQIFQDDVLVLSGTSFSGSPGTPRILWGDATGAAEGVSEWQSFSHNAAPTEAAPEIVIEHPQGSYFGMEQAPSTLAPFRSIAAARQRPLRFETRERAS